MTTIDSSHGSAVITGIFWVELCCWQWYLGQNALMGNDGAWWEGLSELCLRKREFRDES